MPAVAQFSFPGNRSVGHRDAHSSRSTDKKIGSQVTGSCFCLYVGAAGLVNQNVSFKFKRARLHFF
jgi:hypothetical protein